MVLKTRCIKTKIKATAKPIQDDLRNSSVSCIFTITNLSFTVSRLFLYIFIFKDDSRIFHLLHMKLLGLPKPRGRHGKENIYPRTNKWGGGGGKVYS